MIQARFPLVERFHTGPISARETNGDANDVILAHYIFFILGIIIIIIIQFIIFEGLFFHIFRVKLNLIQFARELRLLGRNIKYVK